MIEAQTRVGGIALGQPHSEVANSDLAVPTSNSVAPSTSTLPATSSETSYKGSALVTTTTSTDISGSNEIMLSETVEATTAVNVPVEEPVVKKARLAEDCSQVQDSKISNSSNPIPQEPSGGSERPSTAVGISPRVSQQVHAPCVSQHPEAIQRRKPVQA